MNMYRIKIVCFVALSVLFLISLTQAKKTHSNPFSEIKERSFDFGQVKEGAILEHTFSIRNKGDKVLQVDRVKTS